jgi:predicted methyltransferase
MSLRRNTASTLRALCLGATLLSQACSSASSEPRDPSSAAHEAEASPESWPTEASATEATPSATEASTAESWHADALQAEPAPSEPPPREAAAAVPTSAEPAESDSGKAMVDFFELGPADRVADLGGISGYSLTPIRKAIGPRGTLYVRRRSPPPTDPADESPTDLAKAVWMNTPEEAPLTKEATELNAVTMMFAYHAVVAAKKDRKKLNLAVFRALLRGGVYIVADNAAPPGSGTSAVGENRIEESVIRQEVEAAGFEFVEAGNFMTSAAAALRRPPSSQYVLKFKKP